MQLARSRVPIPFTTGFAIGVLSVTLLGILGGCLPVDSTSAEPIEIVEPGTDPGALPNTNSTWDSAMTVLGFETFLALLAIGGCAFARQPLSARIGWLPGRLSSSQIAILAAGTLGLSSALDGILNLTSLRADSALPELDAMIVGARGGVLMMALLAFGLAPGIAEELLCRGLIQRGLQRRFGPAVAIVLAAGLFGALHIEPIHAVTAAALGIYLGVVCWLADSVRPAIVCHAANNSVAVLGAAFGIGAPAWLGILIGGGIASLALWLVARFGTSHGPPAEPIRGVADTADPVGPRPTTETPNGH